MDPTEPRSRPTHDPSARRCSPPRCRTALPADEGTTDRVRTADPGPGPAPPPHASRRGTVTLTDRVGRSSGRSCREGGVRGRRAAAARPSTRSPPSGSTDTATEGPGRRAEGLRTRPPGRRARRGPPRDLRRAQQRPGRRTVLPLSNRPSRPGTWTGAARSTADPWKLPGTVDPGSRTGVRRARQRGGHAGASEEKE